LEAVSKRASEADLGKTEKKVRIRKDPISNTLLKAQGSLEEQAMQHLLEFDEVEEEGFITGLPERW